MTVGTLIDWVHENWDILAILGAVTLFIIRTTRKIDKFSGKIEETHAVVKKDIPEIKTTLKSHQKELDRLNRYIEDDVKHRDDDQKRSMLICKGVSASLKGLQEIGANGPTHEALDELETYMFEKTSK